jgi:hypothetical protein
MMLEWPGAKPPAVARAVELWSLLPLELADLVGVHGWPSRLADPSTEARLWILALHSGRNRVAQQAVIDRAGDLVTTGQVHQRAYAVAMDQATAADHDQQLYGTMVDPRLAQPFLLSVRDREGLDLRRLAIGLPPIAKDLAQGVDATTVASELSATAGR